MKATGIITATALSAALLTSCGPGGCEYLLNDYERARDSYDIALARWDAITDIITNDPAVKAAADEAAAYLVWTENRMDEAYNAWYDNGCR